MVKTLRLIEWQPYPLPEEERDASALKTLANAGILKLTYQNGKPAVISEGIVGIAKVEDIQISIQPHLVEELLSMLAYALYVPEPQNWLMPAAGEHKPTPTLPDLLADIFYMQVRNIIRRGIEMRYGRKVEVSQNLRGRPQLRNIGRYIPFRGKLPTETWHRHGDTILNRLLMGTAMFIRRHAQSPRATEQMADVIDTLSSIGIRQTELTPSLLREAERVINRNTIHYIPALNTAKALLVGVSDLSAGPARFSGFFVNMAKLFEMAVLRLLETTHSIVFYQRHLTGIITGDKRADIVPDFIIDTAHGKIVADAKYRPIDKMGSEVIYQITIYALALKTTEAYLYYPGTETLTTTVKLPEKTITVTWRGISFSATPPQSRSGYHR